MGWLLGGSWLTQSIRSGPICDVDVPGDVRSPRRVGGELSTGCERVLAVGQTLAPCAVCEGLARETNLI